MVETAYTINVVQCIDNELHFDIMMVREGGE